MQLQALSTRGVILGLSLFAALHALVPDDDGLDLLRDQVRSRDKTYFATKDRRAAVRRLAGMDRVPAWELVIEALADPVPMVADEAEVQLANLRYEPLLAELAKGAGLESRKERVAERAAQLLGRTADAEHPLDPEPLARATQHKDPAVRRMALWSLERLARRAALKDEPKARSATADAVLRAAGRDREPGVRAAALVALAVLAPGAPPLWELPEFPAQIERSLKADEPALRCAALRALGEADPEHAVQRLAAVAADESAAVRTQAVLTLAGLRTSEAARVLVQWLETEPALRLRWRIVARLRELSGRRYGPSPESWRHWVDELEPGALQDEPGDELARGAGEPQAEDDASAGRTRGATFAELSLQSRRLAFLVDFSGSIQKPFDGARTRKQYLESELGRALRSLDEDTRFNLVPYSDEPDPWQDELVPASPRRVKQALEFFGKHRRTGRGDFWEAALLALDDPELDTVVVFTDGAPTGGERWHLALMIDLLLERNRFRHVTFDVILVGAPASLQNEWRRLARETDGTVVVLEPEDVDFDEGRKEGTR